MELITYCPLTKQLQKGFLDAFYIRINFQKAVDYILTAFLLVTAPCPGGALDFTSAQLMREDYLVFVFKIMFERIYPYLYLVTCCLETIIQRGEL